MSIETIRHSLSHILAAAVQILYPKTKLGIGPAIDNGFYYDFKLPKDFSEKELLKIEEKMKELIKQNLKFIKKKISKREANKIFKDQPFKLELIKELKEKEATIYQSGNFIDLCKGPHLKNTKEIILDAFKLEKLAGAYWRGDEKNPMLTRIYGLAFSTKKELDDYVRIQAEIERRDHKKLGPKLGLFLFHQTAPGMAYWLPKGVIIFNELIDFWRQEHQKEGYLEIKSPLLNKKELYETSGHWEHYLKHMFLCQTEEKETYALKPMNCPNAMVIFASQPRSYRELPLRLSDTDTLHRYERSGTLNGLLRVREFSQDDAHIFVAEEQIKEEYSRILKITEKFYSIFGINYSFRLGTRPEKFMGDIKSWNKAEKELKEILTESKKPFIILKGDGTFYGPKIDILMKDSLSRDWQMGTIQLDFQIPKRFNLTYMDKTGKLKNPVVIHRVIYGSLERFIGILLEHTNGKLPTWLSPIQARVLSFTDRNIKAAKKTEEQLKESGIRVDSDLKSETIGNKVRNAELAKIPYIICIGDKEEKSKKLAVRERGNAKIKSMKIDKFIDNIKQEIAERK